MGTITQLPLWDEVSVTARLPRVLYLQHSCEDPEQLSHDLLTCIAMFDRSDGSGREVYRVIAANVVKGRVTAAWEHVCSYRAFHEDSLHKSYCESRYNLKTEGGVIPVYARKESQ